MPEHASGFCECSGNRQAGRVGCGHHDSTDAGVPLVKCMEACLALMQFPLHLGDGKDDRIVFEPLEDSHAGECGGASTSIYL